MKTKETQHLGDRCESASVHCSQSVEVIEEIIAYLTGREAQLRSEAESEETMKRSKITAGRLCECSEILESLKNGNF